MPVWSSKKKPSVEIQRHVRRCGRGQCSFVLFPLSLRQVILQVAEGIGTGNIAHTHLKGLVKLQNTSYSAPGLQQNRRGISWVLYTSSCPIAKHQEQKSWRLKAASRGSEFSAHPLCSAASKICGMTLPSLLPVQMSASRKKQGGEVSESKTFPTCLVKELMECSLSSWKCKALSIWI